MIAATLTKIGRRTLAGLALASLMAGGPALAKDWKTVRVGTDATYPPFESVNPKGEIIGWEIDYATELCTRMKVTCTFQNQDWDGIIPSLIASKFDVIISSMNITPPRTKLVDFSNVDYATPPVFIGLASNTSNDVSPAALKGKTIGTQSSTTFANYLAAYYKDSEIKLYPGGDEPQLDLKAGRIDYTVTDSIVGGTFVDKVGAGCCRIVAEIKRIPEIFGPGVGAAFRKEDSDLRDMFNKAIAEMDADGSYKALEAKYFKIDSRGKSARLPRRRLGRRRVLAVLEHMAGVEGDAGVHVDHLRLLGGIGLQRQTHAVERILLVLEHADRYPGDADFIAHVTSPPFLIELTREMGAGLSSRGASAIPSSRTIEGNAKMPDTAIHAISENSQAGLLADLRAVVGDRGLLTDPADTAPYAEDWRRLYQGRTPAVVRPADTAELARVVALCAARGVPLVPQGGNTSMVGGATPAADGSEIVLSLARLNRVRDLDPVDMTLTIEAGVTLKAAQDAAAAAGALLPLSIASEGTAQIGGILATNAGGNNTVRYGNARDMVLGLEVVLADGQIWNGLRRLRKDNTGYCLRQLFVGAEGTLGIITAAVLKLVPRPVETEVALAAVASPEAALDLFSRFQRNDPAAIQAFEYMSGAGMELVLAHIPGAAMPVQTPAAHYALVELATPRSGARLREAMEEVLAAAMEEGGVLDAVIAESEAQRAGLWKLREEHSEAQKRAGASVKNDVSVPVSKVPELLARASAACVALMPGIRVVAFGHMGDGNIHFNLEQPLDMDAAAFLARDHEIMDAVGEVVRALDGSFSAEHGVGKLKPYMMPDWRGGAELDIMQRIKAALDPAGMLNPGKVLPARL